MKMFYRYGVVVTTSPAFNAEWIGRAIETVGAPMYFRTREDAQHAVDQINAIDGTSALIVAR